MLKVVGYVFLFFVYTFFRLTFDLQDTHTRSRRMRQILLHTYTFDPYARWGQIYVM